MAADLVAFLRARLDEDEATARGAEIAQWIVEHPKKTHDLALAKGLDGRTGTWVVTGEDGEYGIADVSGVRVAAHIARHDPARVLAEVDTKRRIIAAHVTLEPLEDSPSLGPASAPEIRYCPTCQDGDCQTLRLLALPYREHPDYQPEWAPEE